MKLGPPGRPLEKCCEKGGQADLTTARREESPLVQVTFGEAFMVWEGVLERSVAVCRQLPYTANTDEFLKVFLPRPPSAS